MKKDSPPKSGRGRPLAFDPGKAIDAAMRVFWLKGYEGTAVSDLTEAMGINKPSLYGTFGDKRGLFLAALEHYKTSVLGPHVQPLLNATNVRDAVEGHLLSVNHALASKKSPPGCLIGSVATDLAGRDVEIRDQLASLVSASETFLANTFEKLGDAPIDERTLAELVVSIGHSHASRARMGTSEDDLNALTQRFVTTTFGPKEPIPPD